MGRSKDKSDSSPSSSSIITSNKRKPKTKSSPPQRNLYDDVDNISIEDEYFVDKNVGYSDAAKTLVGISKNGRDFDLGDNCDILNAKPMMPSEYINNAMPDFINSGQNELTMGESKALNSSIIRNLMMQPVGKLSATFKAMLINTIRTTVFRRIKFLTNEKLGLEGSVFTLLYETTGVLNKADQQAKYESIRSLIQRQMNSKRNYCTDQIMAKARGKQIIYFWEFLFYFILFHVRTFKDRQDV
jgi:hypothetical protein